VKWFWSSLVSLLLASTVWVAYANVFADESALNARAEQAARAHLGCGVECALVRMEGKRGMYKSMLTFTFKQATIELACKRPYFAFGDYDCQVER